jgi:DNA-binding response OmpR family regulator
VTREELMSHVWDHDWCGSPKVLAVTLRRIRDKLADTGPPDRIENVRGIRYRLSLP